MKLFHCCFLISLFIIKAYADNYSDCEKRLAPDGLVDILGQAKIVISTPIDAARPERGGNEIYGQYCIVCHGSGAAGAPKFGLASAWAPRKAKGIKTLLAHAKTGFNFMPMRGTCMDCSDGELEEAIHYMINHSS